MGLWYWITAEFKALGWYCVAHGPEFWLGVVALCGVVALSIAVMFELWRRGHK